MIKIKNGQVVTYDGIKNTNVYIKEGKIFSVTGEDLECTRVIDAKGMYVSPGFIDTHVHGGNGGDFMDEDKECVQKICDFHFFHGTTTIMPTTLASNKDDIMKAVENIKNNSSCSHADIFGIHLEGPYFSPMQSGAQNSDHIMNPCFEEYDEIIKSGEGFIKKMSFAPELEGSIELCDYLKKNNITCFAGHTDASFSDIENAIEHGLSGITHFYSCTSTVTRNKGFRTAGVIEAGYYFDSITTEMIGDGCHLPPELLRLIYKLKTPDRICLVTDGMRAAGMTGGESVIGNPQNGTKCIIEDGVAKLTDRSAFAGSIATTDRLVRVCKNHAGIDIVDVVKMMCTTPAKTHNIQNKGEIKSGYDADIVIFDEDVNIHTVIKKKNNDIRIFNAGDIS